MRSLGKSNLQVTPLCLGSNVFGWTLDEAGAFRVLDAYVEAGGNFIDTADVYARWAAGPGSSEQMIGNWMRQRGNRARIVLATKVGSPMESGATKVNLSRAYIMHAIEESLRRLQTDYIDLYQAHYDDEQTPLEETLDAFADLVKQGKVRVIGASNYSAPRLAQALKISETRGYPRYESLQPLYNLAQRRDYEAELEPFCREHGLGVIPYSSLASGFLTGKYRQGGPLPSTPRAQAVERRYLNERGFAVLRAVAEVASQYNATPAQAALAWLIARPGITAPIASATSVEQTRELMGALNLQLDQEAINALDRASAGL